MKKRSIILMLVLMTALLSLSATVVSAKSDTPMVCVLDLTFEGPDDWVGSISGCSLEGSITITENWEKMFIVGASEHFFETFTIKPDSGGVIYGEDAGVWNFSTFKFRANGRITSASEEWEDLVGYKFHEMGITSDPSNPPITASGVTMKLHTP
jgi:hypothetical protein